MKSFKSYIDIDLLKNVAIFAIIYNLLFNVQIIYFLYWNSNKTIIHNLMNLIYYFSYIYSGVYILFLGLAISSLINYCGIFLLFFSSMISSFYFYQNRIQPSYKNIKNFLEGNFINMFFDIGNLGLGFYLWLVFCLAILFYLVKRFKIKSADTYFMKIISLICLTIAIYNIAAPSSSSIYNSNPLHFLYILFLYYS
jgi:hypothetical protein